jgi:general L-amino acid transport system substrate-binding protein
VEFLAVSAADRFPKLQSGEIDVLIRNTTFSFDRDTKQGANFGPVIYYDGQTFMVRKADNLAKVEDLNGATICVLKGTTTEQNLADIIAAANIQATTVPFENIDQVIEAFIAKRCDAVTSDRSQLSSRLATAKEGAEWTMFPENFSKEPLAPAIKAGDQPWDDAVRWVVYATIIAEEYGVDSMNVEAKVADAKLAAEAKRLLGVEGDLHTNIGFDKAWAVNVIKQVGNYGEIYQRNLGSLGIARGPNELWSKGGLIYAPPYR